MTRHRRRTARTVVSLLATAALVGSLAACSGGGGSEDNTSQGGKSLTMWTFKQSHVKALETAAAGFKEKTGVDVKVQAITPDDAFITRVQAAAKTGDLPDVLEVHTDGDDFTFGAAGLLDDLSGDVTDDWNKLYLPSVAGEGTVTDTYYQQSLAEGSKTQGVQKGQRFSVPFTIGTFGIVYANKQRLEVAGVKDAPTTWEQFVADLDAVKKTNPDDGGVSIGFQSSTTGLEWLMQPMAYGQLGKADFEALFGKDASKNFASANGQAVLQSYDKITPYWMPGTQTKTIDDADIAFAQGKSSFDIGGTFTLAFLAQNGMDPDNIVTFPVPAPENGAVKDLSLAPFALTGLSVAATTKNKDASLQWLQYLATPEVASQFAKDALDVPPTALDDAQTKALGPVLAAMISSFGDGDDAYNPGYTAFKPNAYDAKAVADKLMELTPLKKADVASTGKSMTAVIDNFWKQS